MKTLQIYYIFTFEQLTRLWSLSLKGNTITYSCASRSYKSDARVKKLAVRDKNPCTFNGNREDNICRHFKHCIKEDFFPFLPCRMLLPCYSHVTAIEIINKSFFCNYFETQIRNKRFRYRSSQKDPK